jgi:hypothetical protein
MDETLREVQEKTGCNHMQKPGERCDMNSGGWWSCGCAIIAWKLESHRANITQAIPEEK